jgi:uncharacterized membrane protein YeaQ/YmgE (transglycosylase-associated protein family)
MTSERPGSLPIKSLILGPAIITLAVTLLRLVGELQGWSPRLFSREPGGAGALVGIVWLAPIFGIYFAMKLARIARPPSAGQAVGYSLAAVALALVSGFAAGAMLKGNQNAQFGVFLVIGLVGAAIAYRGWPALGKTLLAYGLAARVPVAIVMLFAIYANWGTHYDVVPPGFPEMDPLRKWLFIGLVPQLFAWIPFTMIVGAVCGSVAVLVSGKARQAATA